MKYGSVVLNKEQRIGSMLIYKRVCHRSFLRTDSFHILLLLSTISIAYIVVAALFPEHFNKYAYDQNVVNNNN